MNLTVEEVHPISPVYPKGQIVQSVTIPEGILRQTDCLCFLLVTLHSPGGGHEQTTTANVLFLTLSVNMDFENVMRRESDLYAQMKEEIKEYS